MKLLCTCTYMVTSAASICMLHRVVPNQNIIAISNVHEWCWLCVHACMYTFGVQRVNAIDTGEAKLK